MSCTDAEPPTDPQPHDERARDEGPSIERTVELAAPPAAVWDALPDLFGETGTFRPVAGGAIAVVEPDGARAGIVREVVPGVRVAFDWAPVEGDGAPSHVVIELEPRETEAGRHTILHVRETRLGGGDLARSALHASSLHASACARG